MFSQIKRKIGFSFLCSILLSLLFYFRVESHGPIVNPAVYPFNNDDSFKFSSSINEHTKKINFLLDVKTTAWAGIGFVKNGDIYNSELILCYFDQNSMVYCFERDLAGKNNMIPSEGDKDFYNLEDVSGYISGGRTYFNFTRPLNYGNFNIEQGERQQVLFIYGLQQVPNDKAEFFKNSRHVLVNMFIYQKPKEEVTDNVALGDLNIFKLELKINNYKVPQETTTYACRNFDIAQMLQQKTGNPIGTPYHAISFQPQLDQKEHIHHLVILSCPRDIPISDATYLCPTHTLTCFTVHFAWGLGSGTYNLPKDVGILYGVEENRKIILQMHYNNPLLLDNIYDSSFINVFIIPQLRKYDSASMILGVPVTKIAIPPGIKNYEVSNVCGEECYSKMKGPIYIFAAFLHGHTHLRRIRTQIDFLDGTRDDQTIRDDNFVFNHQSYLYLDKPLKIEKGDILTTYCDYDTSNAIKTVIGGDATENEMCYIFVNFFPRENGLSSCMSDNIPGFQCDAFPKYIRKTLRKVRVRRNMPHNEH